MGVAYYKRFRMEIDLDRLPPAVELPTGCRWVAWRASVLPFHAQVKFRCFKEELDAVIFPCLGDHVGCTELMRDIAARRGFVPEATWLVARGEEYIATVQGVIDRPGVGMIQNLGVVPEARSLGVGAALLIQSLRGFRAVGLTSGVLEVTADNTRAVRLYRRLGFRRARTVYKAVSVP